MERKFLFCIILLSIFLIGCSNQNVNDDISKTDYSNNCKAPYSFVNKKCCLDSNQNQICDAYEVNKNNSIINNHDKAKDSVTINNSLEENFDLIVENDTVIKTLEIKINSPTKEYVTNDGKVYFEIETNKNSKCYLKWNQSYLAEENSLDWKEMNNNDGIFHLDENGLSYNKDYDYLFQCNSPGLNSKKESISFNLKTEYPDLFIEENLFDNHRIFEGVKKVDEIPLFEDSIDGIYYEGMYKDYTSGGCSCRPRLGGDWRTCQNNCGEMAAEFPMYIIKVEDFDLDELHEKVGMTLLEKTYPLHNGHYANTLNSLGTMSKYKKETLVYTISGYGSSESTYSVWMSSNYLIINKGTLIDERYFEFYPSISSKNNCFDLDGGENEFIKSFAMDFEFDSNNIYGHDYCSSNTLNEFFCNSNGDLERKEIVCDNGCQSGYCIE